MEPTTASEEKTTDAPVETHRVEKDWTDAGWKHPYVLYLGGTIFLFGFLLLMGYLALDNDWIPKR
jgi:hypothetical protein